LRQWRNEWGAGKGGRPWAQMKRGSKMSLSVYILIYFGGQMVHKGGAKLGFHGNFVSNIAERGRQIVMRNG